MTSDDLSQLVDLGLPTMRQARAHKKSMPRSPASELGQDSGHVALHGAAGQVHAGTDLRIGQALRDQARPVFRRFLSGAEASQLRWFTLARADGRLSVSRCWSRAWQVPAVGRGDVVQ